MSEIEAYVFRESMSRTKDVLDAINDPLRGRAEATHINQPHAFVAQGWQCPSCLTVYAPFVPSCGCERKAAITNTSSGTQSAPIDDVLEAQNICEFCDRPAMDSGLCYGCECAWNEGVTNPPRGSR